MSVAYNPLSGNFETKEPGPQGPAGTVSAAGDGSQATPSISFASDTNTGLFKHAADSIGVSTGGTTRMVIDSSGVVSVKKPGSANQANLFITAGGAGDPATQDPRIQFGASGFESPGTTEIRSTGSFNSRALAFYTGSNANGSEKMRLTSSGRLGLGTSSPSGKLSVETSNSDSTPFITSFGTYNGSAGSIFLRGGSLNSYYYDFKRNGSNGNLEIQGNQAGFNNICLAPTSGRVAIGNASPVSDLDISGSGGSSGVTLTLSNGGNVQALNDPLGIINFYSNDASTNASGVKGSIACRNEYNGHWDGTPTKHDTYLTFSTATNSVNSEKVRIDSAGNFKLGGTLPSSPNIRLNADGSSVFRSVLVNQSSGTNADIEFNQSGVAAAKIGIPASQNALAFNMWTGSAYTERMRMDASGNATFDGTVKSTPASGSYAFDVTAGSTNLGGLYRDSSGANLLLKPADGSAAKVYLKGDGTGTFAGAVHSINASASTQFMIGTNTGSAAARAQFGYATGVNHFLNGAASGDVCITFPSKLRFGLGNASSTVVFYTDGSAYYAGTVQAGGNPGGGVAAGSRIRHEGLVEAARSGTQDLWKGFVVGSSSPTSRIKSDGSAEFAGDVEVGNASVVSSNGVLLNANGRVFVRKQSGTAFQAVSGTGAQQSTKIQLNADGSASFAANVGVTGSLFCRSTFKVFDGSAVAPNCTINTNGSASFAGAVTAQGTTLTSDQRFKTNLSDAKSQLADVTALGNQLRNWDWTDDAPVADKDTRFLGLVAQDVETVCPGLVTTIARTKQGAELTPETTDEEGNVVPATYEQLDDSYKGIKHDVLVMKLLGAVAELSAKVAALESA